MHNHPFKPFLTNLHEINIGHAIKKLNKEEIIDLINNFFDKIIGKFIFYNKNNKFYKFSNFIKFFNFILKKNKNFFLLKN